jgi:hypothetical protein
LLLWLFIALAPGVQAAEPAPVSTDELERLVQSLQDDTAREKLVEQLRALIAAQRGTEKENPPGRRSSIRLRSRSRPSPAKSWLALQWWSTPRD